MSVKRDILWRVYIAYFLVCALGIAVLVKTFIIQNIEGQYWRSMADSLTTAFKPIEAIRGNIYADDGSLLATSLPLYEVRMDLNAGSLSKEVFYSQIDSLALCMSSYYRELPPFKYRRELINARLNKERYHLIRNNVSFTELKEMKKWPLFRLGHYKGGFITEQRSKRVKPFKMLASRTIGYIREGIKPVGMEGAFNNYLEGSYGKRLMQKISGGIWIPINDDNEIEPEDGKDIITALNVNLQDVAESALLKQLILHNADHGCVILMEVKTGEIKAIANLGRDTTTGDYTEKYNYAIGESTEPGSTFKLASMLVLLEDDKVTLTDSIDIESGITQFYDKEMRDSKTGEYDSLTVSQAFEFSSNVGISKLVFKNYADDPSRFVKYLRRIGLDKPLNLPLTGEGAPQIKNPDDKNWSGVTLPWMSIGYEIRLTPLQMLTFYNAIANNGKMVKPLFVTGISNRGELIRTFDTEILNERICSPSTIKQLQFLLEGVVEKGTAKNLTAAHYKIAGKTGTAKIANKLHGYKSNTTYQASFAGYFPADKPKYSCIVVVNAPSNNVYYANLVAGPVFREIADKVYASDLDNRLLIAENNSDHTIQSLPHAKAGNKADTQKIYDGIGCQVVCATDAEWVTTNKKENAIELIERKVIQNLVPNVIGMGLQDAIYLLENSGLKVFAVGNGKVKSQSKLVGARILKGDQIKIILS